jgi:hypothetical protein
MADISKIRAVVQAGTGPGERIASMARISLWLVADLSVEKIF